MRNCKCYFSNDIINIETFDPNNIKTGEKLLKKYSYLLYWICDNKIARKIYRVNPLYLIFSNVNGDFEVNNGNKYLALVSTNQSKEVLKKYEELWIKIRDLVSSISKNSDGYN